MKRKAKKKKAPRKYATMSMHFTPEQMSTLKQVAEYADSTVDNVLKVFLGAALYMGRMILVAEQAPLPTRRRPRRLPRRLRRVRKSSHE